MIDDLLRFWPVLVVLAQGLSLWIWWSLARKFVTHEYCRVCRSDCAAGTKERVAATDGKHTGLDKRLRDVEAVMPTVPASGELQDLALELARTRGDLVEVRAKVEGLGEILERVERPLNLLMEHHLRESGRSR